MRTRAWLAGGAALIATCAIAAPGARIRALAGVEPGKWVLRDGGADNGTRELCVRDPGELVQVQHAAAACERFVVDESDAKVTVRYACRGAGSGLTTVEIENPRLVQIDSQGMDHGAPFALDLEGRRVGACDTAALSGR